jgi:hypothetical protein
LHSASERLAAKDNAAQAAAGPYVPVPEDPKYSLHLFLDQSDETATGGQRPPPGFGKVRSDAEAEAEGKARMQKKLSAFDAKFNGGGRTAK